MQNRESALNNWLKTILNHTSFTVLPLAGDASFRRYFRVISDQKTKVIMDAPPTLEAMQQFEHVESILAKLGIITPTIHAIDHGQGFALLEDLGDDLLLGKINLDNADRLYGSAIQTLVRIQQAPINDPKIPFFNQKFMLKELGIFNEWFLNAWLKFIPNPKDAQLIGDTFDWLVTQITTQPQVLIHRDYHSRNLLLINENIGVIDFQDAMYGPLAYDLVSLLRDCYIQWPEEKVQYWLTQYHQLLPTSMNISLKELQRGFDLCGLQRHLKVLGNFCRLHLRDNKSAYLRDLPLTLKYTMSCLAKYEELQPFYQFMQQQVETRFSEYSEALV